VELSVRADAGPPAPKIPVATEKEEKREPPPAKNKQPAALAVQPELRETPKAGESSNPGPAPLKVVVLFDFGAVALSELAKAELDSLSPGKSYAVYGYTCDLGSVKANERIARDRAKSVADYLKVKGMDIAVQEGKPGCCYFDIEKRFPDTKSLRMRISRTLNDHLGEKEKELFAAMDYVRVEMVRGLSRRVEVLEITPTTDGKETVK
jgi:hypothetical protein